jgi:hypothetical protein
MYLQRRFWVYELQFEGPQYLNQHFEDLCGRDILSYTQMGPSSKLQRHEVSGA